MFYFTERWFTGAKSVLHGFRYIKCEVADFPARTGTPSVAELDAILRRAGVAQLIRRMFARGPGNRGTYWDIVWKRVEPGIPLTESGLKLPFVAHAQDVEGQEKLPGYSWLSGEGVQPPSSRALPQSPTPVNSSTGLPVSASTMRSLARPSP
jgi:hypothetical protein